MEMSRIITVEVASSGEISGTQDSGVLRNQYLYTWNILLVSSKTLKNVTRCGFIYWDNPSIIPTNTKLLIQYVRLLV